MVISVLVVYDQKLLTWSINTTLFSATLNIKVPALAVVKLTIATLIIRRNFRGNCSGMVRHQLIQLQLVDGDSNQKDEGQSKGLK